MNNFVATYGKFKKIRIGNDVGIEETKKIIDTFLTSNGIVDLSVFSYEDVQKILEVVTRTCSFTHSDTDIVNQIKNNTIYHINKMINNKNFNEIFDGINIKIDFLNFDLIIDLADMTEEQLTIIEKFKEIPLTKYYSNKIWSNKFITIGKEIEDLKFLELFNNIDKNECIGNMTCHKCKAFSICSLSPDILDEIKTTFNQDKKCEILQKISDENIQVIDLKSFKDISSCVSADINRLGTEIANNNVFLNNLSLSLINVLSLMKGDNNE